MSPNRYGILGAGRQGTAAAYDLVVRGDARSIVLADVDLDRAKSSAARVNRLATTDLATAAQLDATDPAALAGFLDPLDAYVSSASYRLNLVAARSAVTAGTHMCDLGGNTPIVLQQLQLDAAAKERGVCIVPDCGEAPGLSSNMLAYAATLLDRTDELILLDGGLPANPQPPWNYVLTFNVDGLTNEYDGTTTWLLDGELVEIDCLDPAHDELVEFEPPFGTLEAFVAATGSTTPRTLRDRTRSLKAKVLRYPGHAAQFRTFRDLGLFSETPVSTGDREIVPRDVFHALLEPKLRGTPDTPDVVVARVIATGIQAGDPATATVDLRVHPDQVLGFTAMERATGWHAAIVCHLMASGTIAPGATPVELAVDPASMMEALKDRGFELTTSIE